MMQQVYKTLPDDRPIMSINIIEDPEKCPTGFVVISRTHDQDSDADLWRDGSFFGKKVTRYVCLSKTEGISDFIVQSVTVINEKEIPPDGYALISRTADSDQKAWRKRQLCYRLMRRDQATSAVTDIIIMGRLKKAPMGFSLAGEINGMTVCFKCGPSVAPVNKPIATQPSQLLYSLSPASTLVPHIQSSQPSSVVSVVNKAPTNGVTGDDSPHEYERLTFLQPSRPAPKPPGASHSSYATLAAYSDHTLLRPSRPAPKPPGAIRDTYATIAAYSGLDGVPFILNPYFQNLTLGYTNHLPVIKSKTKYEMDREYDYDFRVERET